MTTPVRVFTTFIQARNQINAALRFAAIDTLDALAQRAQNDVTQYSGQLDALLKAYPEDAFRDSVVMNRGFSHLARKQWQSIRDLHPAGQMLGQFWTHAGQQFAQLNQALQQTQRLIPELNVLAAEPTAVLTISLGDETTPHDPSELQSVVRKWSAFADFVETSLGKRTPARLVSVSSGSFELTFGIDFQTIRELVVLTTALLSFHAARLAYQTQKLKNELELESLRAKNIQPAGPAPAGSPNLSVSGTEAREKIIEAVADEVIKDVADAFAQRHNLTPEDAAVLRKYSKDIIALHAAGGRLIVDGQESSKQSQGGAEAKQLIAAQSAFLASGSDPKQLGPGGAGKKK